MEEGFNNWLFKYYNNCWDFTWFKLSTNQNEWIKSSYYTVDKIIKFETLQQDFNEIDYFKNYQLPFKNKGPIRDKTSYKDYYNYKSIKFIKDLYEEDIDVFKYAF